MTSPTPIDSPEYTANMAATELCNTPIEEVYERCFVDNKNKQGFTKSLAVKAQWLLRPNLATISGNQDKQRVAILNKFTVVQKLSLLTMLSSELRNNTHDKAIVALLWRCTEVDEANWSIPFFSANTQTPELAERIQLRASDDNYLQHQIQHLLAPHIKNTKSSDTEKLTKNILKGLVEPQPHLNISQLVKPHIKDEKSCGTIAKAILQEADLSASLQLIINFLKAPKPHIHGLLEKFPRLCEPLKKLLLQWHPSSLKLALLNKPEQSDMTSNDPVRRRLAKLHGSYSDKTTAETAQALNYYLLEGDARTTKANALSLIKNPRLKLVKSLTVQHLVAIIISLKNAKPENTQQQLVEFLTTYHSQNLQEVLQVLLNPPARGRHTSVAFLEALLHDESGKSGLFFSLIKNHPELTASLIYRSSRLKEMLINQFSEKLREHIDTIVDKLTSASPEEVAVAAKHLMEMLSHYDIVETYRTQSCSKYEEVEQLLEKTKQKKDKSVSDYYCLFLLPKDELHVILEEDAAFRNIFLTPGKASELHLENYFQEYRERRTEYLKKLLVLQANTIKKTNLEQGTTSVRAATKFLRKKTIMPAFLSIDHHDTAISHVSETLYVLTAELLKWQVLEEKSKFEPIYPTGSDAVLTSQKSLIASTPPQLVQSNPFSQLQLSDAMLDSSDDTKPQYSSFSVINPETNRLSNSTQSGVQRQLFLNSITNSSSGSTSHQNLLGSHDLDSTFVPVPHHTSQVQLDPGVLDSTLESNQQHNSQLSINPADLYSTFLAQDSSTGEINIHDMQQILSSLTQDTNGAHGSTHSATDSASQSSERATTIYELSIAGALNRALDSSQPQEVYLKHLPKCRTILKPAVRAQLFAFLNHCQNAHLPPSARFCWEYLINKHPFFSRFATELQPCLSEKVSQSSESFKAGVIPQRQESYYEHTSVYETGTSYTDNGLDQTNQSIPEDAGLDTIKQWLFEHCNFNRGRQFTLIEDTLITMLLSLTATQRNLVIADLLDKTPSLGKSHVGSDYDQDSTESPSIFWDDEVVRVFSRETFTRKFIHESHDWLNQLPEKIQIQWAKKSLSIAIKLSQSVRYNDKKRPKIRKPLRRAHPRSLAIHYLTSDPKKPHLIHKKEHADFLKNMFTFQNQGEKFYQNTPPFLNFNYFLQDRNIYLPYLRQFTPQDWATFFVVLSEKLTEIDSAINEEEFIASNSQHFTIKNIDKLREEKRTLLKNYLYFFATALSDNTKISENSSTVSNVLFAMVKGCLASNSNTLLIPENLQPVVFSACMENENLSICNQLFSTSPSASWFSRKSVNKKLLTNAARDKIDFLNMLARYDLHGRSNQHVQVKQSTFPHKSKRGQDIFIHEFIMGSNLTPLLAMQIALRGDGPILRDCEHPTLMKTEFYRQLKKALFSDGKNSLVKLAMENPTQALEEDSLTHIQAINKILENETIVEHLDLGRHYYHLESLLLLAVRNDLKPAESLSPKAWGLIQRYSENELLRNRNAFKNALQKSHSAEKPITRAMISTLSSRSHFASMFKYIMSGEPLRNIARLGMLPFGDSVFRFLHDAQPSEAETLRYYYPSVFATPKKEQNASSSNTEQQRETYTLPKPVDCPPKLTENQLNQGVNQKKDPKKAATPNHYLPRIQKKGRWP